MDPSIQQDVMGSEADLAPERHCTYCGAEAEPSWVFCGTCGKPLGTLVNSERQPRSRAADQNQTAEYGATVIPSGPPADAAAGEASARSPQKRRHRFITRIALYSLGAVLLLTLMAGGAYAYQQTVNELDETSAELSTTQVALGATSRTLAETEDSLTTSRSELADTNRQLDEAQNRLRVARRQLSGLEGSLDDAEDRLDLQANQIETLKSCLDGVTNAMSYAAHFDYGAAIAALDAVEISCNRAYELF